VKKPGATVTREELLAFFDGKVAKWWLPDDAVFVDELPHTATGKLLKLKLREQFRSYVLPTALAVEGCPFDPAQEAGSAGATGTNPPAMRE